VACSAYYEYDKYQLKDIVSFSLTPLMCWLKGVVMLHASLGIVVGAGPRIQEKRIWEEGMGI